MVVWGNYTRFVLSKLVNHSQKHCTMKKTSITIGKKVLTLEAYKGAATVFYNAQELGFIYSDKQGWYSSLRSERFSTRYAALVEMLFQYQRINGVLADNFVAPSGDAVVQVGIDSFDVYCKGQFEGNVFKMNEAWYGVGHHATKEAAISSISGAAAFERMERKAASRIAAREAAEQARIEAEQAEKEAAEQVAAEQMGSEVADIEQMVKDLVNGQCSVCVYEPASVYSESEPENACYEHTSEEMRYNWSASAPNPPAPPTPEKIAAAKALSKAIVKHADIFMSNKGGYREAYKEAIERARDFAEAIGTEPTKQAADTIIQHALDSCTFIPYGSKDWQIRWYLALSATLIGFDM